SSPQKLEIALHPSLLTLDENDTATRPARRWERQNSSSRFAANRDSRQRPSWFAPVVDTKPRARSLPRVVRRAVGTRILLRRVRLLLCELRSCLVGKRPAWR